MQTGQTYSYVFFLSLLTNQRRPKSRIRANGSQEGKGKARGCDMQQSCPATLGPGMWHAYEPLAFQRTPWTRNFYPNNCRQLVVRWFWLLLQISSISSDVFICCISLTTPFFCAHPQLNMRNVGIQILYVVMYYMSPTYYPTFYWEVIDPSASVNHWHAVFAEQKNHCNKYN